MNKILSAHSVCKEVGLLTAKKSIPIYIFWELTRSCNLSCVHCYVNKEKRRELSFKDISLGINKLKRLGSLVINFSGGEILLREDFLRIALFAKRAGFAVKIFTNGTKINNSVIAELKKIKPLYVEISVYSKTPRIHDNITKVSGSWGRSMEAVNNLTRNGLRVRLKCSLIKKNLKSFKETNNFFQSLKLPYQFNPILMPVKNRNVGLNKVQRSVAFKSIVTDTSSGLTKEAKLRMPMCSAGINSLTINAYGDLLPCIAFPVKIGNILDDDIRDVWNNSVFLNKLRKIKNKELVECSVCKYIESCSRCPGIALLRNGDYLKPYSEACELAYFRSVARN